MKTNTKLLIIWIPSVTIVSICAYISFFTLMPWGAPDKTFQFWSGLHVICPLVGGLFSLPAAGIPMEWILNWITKDYL